MIRLLVLGNLWFIVFCLTMAVLELLWERRQDRIKEKRARELHPGLAGLQAIEKLSSSEERAQRWRTGNPYEWEPKRDNGNDESRENGE